MLPLHRTGRQPEGRVQKAVRFAEGDNALRAALEEQRAFDDRLVEVIHVIRPPGNLRQKLREAGDATATAKRFRLLNPATLTAICGLLLIAGFFVWVTMERLEKFPGRESVERMLSGASRMSVAEVETVSGTAGGLGDWFYMRGFEGFSVPPELAKLPIVGAQTFRAETHPVAQLMVDRQDSILYVFRTSDFGIQMAGDEPWKIIEHEGWAAGLRRIGNLSYLLAIRGTKAEAAALIASLKP